MEANQGNLDSLYIGYKASFNKSIRSIVSWFEMIAQAESSSTAAEQYFFREELARMREFKGEHIFRTAGFLGFLLTNKVFSDAVRVPIDAINDDQYGKYNGLIEEMGEGAAMLPDDLGITLIEAGTTVAGYDGQFYFDTDHPVSFFDASLGVQSNLMTTLPLTAANLELALARMASFKDATGRSMKIKPNILMVPSGLEITARTIVQAALTVNGGTNVITQMGLTVMVNHDLTSQTDWYLLSTQRRIKPFIYQKREAPKLTRLDRQQDVVEKREAKYIVDARAVAGYGRWQLALKAVAA